MLGTHEIRSRQGITGAFLDAELCATAIDEAFGEGRPYDEAMTGYQQTRDNQVMPIYEFTTQLASLEPPPPEMPAEPATCASRRVGVRLSPLVCVTRSRPGSGTSHEQAGCVAHNRDDVVKPRHVTGTGLPATPGGAVGSVDQVDPLGSESVADSV